MNCLLTKLKATVDNDNLLKEDEFIIHGVTSTSAFRIISGVSGGKATILGDGYFDVSGTHTKEYSTETGTEVSIVCNEPVDIKVNKKYNVYYISVPNFYMEDYAWCTSLETIQALFYSGNIESLEHTSLYRCAITGKDVYGDISKLPAGGSQIWIRYTAVTASNLATFVASTRDANDTIILLTGNQAITGSIEEIVSACVDANRVNKTITLSIRDTQVTFGGSDACSKAAELYSDAMLKWTDKTHIIFQCGTDADVEDPTKTIDIWAKGASSEQISIWESENNIVHIVS